MIRFSYEEQIAASPEAVFAVMSDIGRFDEWLGMDGRPKDPGRARVGARFDSTSRLGPMRVESQGEVTSFEPSHRFGFRLVTPGAFDFEIDIRLEPDDRGTRMKGSGSMTTHRLWRLLEPILRGELQKGEAAEAARLKALVEAGAADGVAS
jgi:uncharacterized protein YndB with AHSA1/START domain